MLFGDPASLLHIIARNAGEPAGQKIRGVDAVFLRVLRQIAGG